MKAFTRSLLLPGFLCAAAFIYLLVSWLGETPRYATGPKGELTSGTSESAESLSAWPALYYAVWSAPQVITPRLATLSGDIVASDARILALVNSAADEADPCETHDGEILLFASNRPNANADAGEADGGYDLFWCRREGVGYGLPQRFPAPITSVYHELSPSLARHPNGEYTLLFTSNRALGAVDHDLYFARGTFGGAWSAPQPLRTTATNADERAAVIFPAADRIAFSREERGKIDFWETWVLPGGEWSQPQRIATLAHPHNEARLALAESGTQLQIGRASATYAARLELLRPVPPPPRAYEPALVLLLLALFLFLLRMLSMRWRTLEIIYWCLLISLLIHVLLWWLLHDHGVRSPGAPLDGPDDPGSASIVEFSRELFQRSGAAALMQAAIGENVAAAAAAAEAENTATADSSARLELDDLEREVGTPVEPAVAQPTVPELAESTPTSSSANPERESEPSLLAPTPTPAAVAGIALADETRAAAPA
ncbi:MAG: hypothetical protein ACKVX7_05765, partial [Planctomycetota bacterium]